MFKHDFLNLRSKILNCFLQKRNFTNINERRSKFKDTIYSLSTGFGKSAIAVIRVSG